MKKALRIMVKHINNLKETAPHSLAAKEIHEHYIKFFEWFLWQDEINRETVGKDRKGKVYVMDYDGTRKTIPEIYAYYIKNVLK